MPTIALVDDDRNILTSLRMVLEAEGYKTQTYNDGASALDGFAESPPDLAILDIKMPRMDGMELLRRLRQRSELFAGEFAFLLCFQSLRHKGRKYVVELPGMTQGLH